MTWPGGGFIVEIPSPASGITTTNGNPGGTTVVDTTRTEPNDHWNGMALLITSGAQVGQVREITDWVLGTGTFTVAPAFGGQILADITYKILAHLPADIDIAAIEAKLDARLDAAVSGRAAPGDAMALTPAERLQVQTELTFQHQPDATLVQLTPVQNTWYTILDTTLNCRIYSVTVLVWTTNETLEVRVTIDGQVLTGSLAATHTIYYYVHLQLYAAGFAINGNVFPIGKYMPLEGRSVKVEVRKTTANGTGTLEGRVIYAKR